MDESLNRNNFSMQTEEQQQQKANKQACNGGVHIYTDVCV